MGLVTVGARLGGILAPFIVMLGDQHENLQFTVFGMLSLAAGDSFGYCSMSKVNISTSSGAINRVEFIQASQT